MALRKPILCLDFDGVIHSYKSGWKGAGKIPDPPVPGAIPYILTALETFDVAIFSSRSKSIAGRWAMKRWLSKAIADHWEQGGHEPSLAECECWGDAAGITRRFSWPWFKPPALITIDDRALTFNGDWTDGRYSPRMLQSFKPWMKQPPPQCFVSVSGDPDRPHELICDLCEAVWPDRNSFSCPKRKAYDRCK